MFGKKNDKSIHIDGDNRGVAITGDGNTVNLPPHIIPKKLTPQTGLANDIDFVGRKEELQKVDELLNQNSMLLLLNGIGGIGKSTLASYYLNQHKDNFDYYGFVQVNEDIKLSLASAFGTSLDLKSEKIDDLFAEIMNKLQNLEGKKLLIIDDVKEMDSQIDEIKTLMTLKNNSGFQILFTSRESKDFLPEYTLNIMNPEDARELFLNYYPTDEIDKVDKILKEYLDYHTLFIEITAKTLKQRKKTLSFDKMIEKFANGEFSSIKKSKRESFNLFLSDLFSNDKILQDEENILFLKRLSVLPSIEISFEDLYKFLVCEDEERLEVFLIELVDNGWLIESEHAYKFHQILKEFIWYKHEPIFGEIEIIMDSFFKVIGDNSDALVAVNNRENIVYLESLVILLYRLKSENEKVGYFFASFGLIYQHLGFYQKAEPYIIKASEIYEKLFGKKNVSTAISYVNLAELYRLTGKYKKAEPLYLKASKILEKSLGKEHLDTAISYNNLASLYQISGENRKAKPLYLKVLNIFEKVLGEEHPYTATLYNNLAEVYQSIGEYKKAEKFYLKDLKISEKVLGEEHPNTATSYNNVAKFYHGQRDFERAYKFMKRAVEVRLKILPSNHPHLIDSKEWLEMIELRFNLQICTPSPKNML